jgi:hypothetical protein
VVTYVPRFFAGGTPAMSKDAEITARELSTTEDFDRFSLVETLDADADITDESCDEDYGEENAGA